MKTSFRMLITWVAVLLLAGAAQAVSFDVSSSFSGLVGNNEGFKWSVASMTIAPFNITVGGSHTFTYGKFITGDFPVDNSDGNDNDDHFTAGLTIIPPDPATIVPGIGYPDAVKSGYWVWLWYVDTSTASVNFDNTPIERTFGNGGKYTVTFNDIAGIDHNNDICDPYYDLTATIALISDSTPVPEPGTILLLGTGLFGLAIFGKRRMIK